MTTKPETLPVMYILMRNDLASMNAGKAMAQSSHASDAMTFKATEMGRLAELKDWKASTKQGFGTVLVLQAKMSDIKSTISDMQEKGYIADIVFDPSYPIVDGSVVHHIPLHTCGFVFVGDKYTDFTAAAYLSEFSLHI